MYILISIQARINLYNNKIKANQNNIFRLHLLYFNFTMLQFTYLQHKDVILYFYAIIMMLYFLTSLYDVSSKTQIIQYYQFFLSSIYCTSIFYIDYSV